MATLMVGGGLLVFHALRAIDDVGCWSGGPADLLAARCSPWLPGGGLYAPPAACATHPLEAVCSVVPSRTLRPCNGTDSTPAAFAPCLVCVCAVLTFFFLCAAWKDKKDGTQVIAADRYLEPYADSLRYRYVILWHGARVIQRIGFFTVGVPFLFGILGVCGSCLPCLACACELGI